jgi:hypothetical protein
VDIAAALSVEETAGIAAAVALAPAIASAIYARKQSGYAKASARAATESANAADRSAITAAEQLGSSRDVALGQLLLTFDELLLQSYCVHKALHPRSTTGWTVRNPPSADEQIRLELYMGLFERLWLLAERHIVPIEIVKSLYSYRVRNLVNNEWVRKEKLEAQAGGWDKFLRLCQALEIPVR